VGVVGCGQVARHIHLPILRGLPDVAVVALVDPDPGQRALASQLCPEASQFSQLSDLWDTVLVDAILIAAPTGQHAELIMQALARGVHIYAEKPLAVSPADGRTIVNTWQQRGTVGMIGFNYRFHPLYQQARRLLAENAIGRPLLVSTIFSSSAPVGAGDWRARRDGGGGVLADLGSHHVDLVRFLLGAEAVEMRAQTSSIHTADDTATLQMRLANDVLVSGVFSFGSADQDRIEIIGDRAILRVDRYLSTECEIFPRAGGPSRLRQISTALSFLWRPGAILAKRTPGGDPSYRAAIQQFVQAARTGAPCAPDFSDGLRALEVIAAAQESAHERARVQEQAPETENASRAPGLSVVLVTNDRYSRLRKTMAHLARQTARSSIEVVIVSPAPLPDVDPADFPCFAGFHSIQTGPFRDTGSARAAGARACAAPIIAFGEDHCFPEPTWAEHLIDAFAGPWSAASPAMYNANPGAISAADFLLNFGHSAYPLPESAAKMVPWHNTAYRRDLLHGYGDRLAHMLEAEVRIHTDLEQRGLKMFMAGSLRVHHVNLSSWGSFLACQFFGGRLYGAARAEAGNWSAPRKLFYTAMLPLIPLRRAPDIRHHAKRTAAGAGPAFWMACAAGLMASALGEVSGYLFGQGDMGYRRITYEFERERYIRPSDLIHLQPVDESAMAGSKAAGI
jgi:predicted dehydrogenase